MNTQLTLVSTINGSVLQDATSFPKQGGYVHIDDEIMFYKSKSDTTVTKEF